MATIEELEASLKKAMDQIGSLSTQLQGLEKVHSSWGTEMGTIRTEAKTLQDSVKKFQDEFKKTGDVDFTKVKDMVDKYATIVQSVEELKKNVPGKGEQKGKEGEGATKTDDEVIVEIKKKVSKDQQKVIDGAFAKLSTEDRIAISGDKKKTRQFLEAATASIPPDAPKSLFGEPEAEKNGEGENPFVRLFKSASKKENHVPGSRQVHGSVGSGNEQAREDQKSYPRLADGHIPRPTDKSKTGE